MNGNFPIFGFLLDETKKHIQAAMKGKLSRKSTVNNNPK